MKINDPRDIPALKMISLKMKEAARRHFVLEDLYNEDFTELNDKIKDEGLIFPKNAQEFYTWVQTTPTNVSRWSFEQRLRGFSAEEERKLKVSIYNKRFKKLLTEIAYYGKKLRELKYISVKGERKGAKHLIYLIAVELTTKHEDLTHAKALDLFQKCWQLSTAKSTYYKAPPLSARKKYQKIIDEFRFT